MSDAEDAARWRALMNCRRMSLMGSAGFGHGKPGEGEFPDAWDYRHMTINFWSVMGPDYSPDGPDENTLYCRKQLIEFTNAVLRMEAVAAFQRGEIGGALATPITDLLDGRIFVIDSATANLPLQFRREIEDGEERVTLYYKDGDVLDDTEVGHFVELGPKNYEVRAPGGSGLAPTEVVVSMRNSPEDAATALLAITQMEFGATIVP